MEVAKEKQQVALDQIAKQVESAYVDWIALISSEEYSDSAWFTLTPVSQKSVHGATLTVLDDQSILAGGENPSRDTFEIEFTTDQQHLSGFKLEALLDDSLPGKGPGRYTAERPNFVLQEFMLEADGKKIKLHSAIADFSQLNFSPTWRKDYEKLNRFRMKLYGEFLWWKLRYYPFSILKQSLNFLSRNFNTKMEMTPYRALHVVLMLKGFIGNKIQREKR